MALAAANDLKYGAGRRAEQHGRLGRCHNPTPGITLRLVPVAG
jgi:hypothetical protein